MNYFRKTALSVAVITGMFASGQSMAAVEGNIGAASNYIWRGVSQTGDQSAISGGLDYSNESGFYLGTWTSNVSWTPVDGYELDVYAGYGGEAGTVSYDLGYIAYLYPVGDHESDFSEVYANLGMGGLTLGLSYQVDAEASGATDPMYISAAYDVELSEDYGLSLYGGDYDFDGAGGDYTHYGVAISKAAGDFGDLTFAIDKNDLDGPGADDPRVSVVWGKTF